MHDSFARFPDLSAELRILVTSFVVANIGPLWYTPDGDKSLTCIPSVFLVSKEMRIEAGRALFGGTCTRTNHDRGQGHEFKFKLQHATTLPFTWLQQNPRNTISVHIGDGYRVDFEREGWSRPPTDIYLGEPTQVSVHFAYTGVQHDHKVIMQAMGVLCAKMDQNTGNTVLGLIPTVVAGTPTLIHRDDFIYPLEGAQNLGQVNPEILAPSDSRTCLEITVERIVPHDLVI